MRLLNNSFTYRHPTKMSATPFVKWAQREDKVFITVEATGATDSKIELKPEGVFKCSGTWGPDKKEYEVELEFHGAIDVEESKQLVNELKLFFTIVKSEAGPYWPRLLKDKVKRHWLKIDFDKWKDEDDDEEEEKPDNYDAPGMQGMGGMPGGMPPGMGGMPGMGGGGGGPGGMDMEAMMKAMGGMGGGAGGGMPDMAEMMAKMGGGAGGPGAPGGGEDEDDQPDSDDGDMPELE